MVLSALRISVVLLVLGQALATGPGRPPQAPEMLRGGPGGHQQLRVIPENQIFPADQIIFDLGSLGDALDNINLHVDHNPYDHVDEPNDHVDEEAGPYEVSADLSEISAVPEEHSFDDSSVASSSSDLFRALSTSPGSSSLEVSPISRENSMEVSPIAAEEDHPMVAASSDERRVRKSASTTNLHAALALHGGAVRGAAEFVPSSKTLPLGERNRAQTTNSARASTVARALSFEEEAVPPLVGKENGAVDPVEGLAPVTGGGHGSCRNWEEFVSENVPEGSDPVSAEVVAELVGESGASSNLRHAAVPHPAFVAVQKHRFFPQLVQFLKEGRQGFMLRKLLLKGGRPIHDDQHGGGSPTVVEAFLADWVALKRHSDQHGSDEWHKFLYSWVQLALLTPARRAAEARRLLGTGSAGGDVALDRLLLWDDAAHGSLADLDAQQHRGERTNGDGSVRGNLALDLAKLTFTVEQKCAANSFANDVVVVGDLCAVARCRVDGSVQIEEHRIRACTRAPGYRVIDATGDVHRVLSEREIEAREPPLSGRVRSEENRLGVSGQVLGEHERRPASGEAAAMMRRSLKRRAAEGEEDGSDLCLPVAFWRRRIGENGADHAVVVVSEAGAASSSGGGPSAGSAGSQGGGGARFLAVRDGADGPQPKGLRV